VVCVCECGLYYRVMCVWFGVCGLWVCGVWGFGWVSEWCGCCVVGVCGVCWKNFIYTWVWVWVYICRHIGVCVCGVCVCRRADVG